MKLTFEALITIRLSQDGLKPSEIQALKPYIADEDSSAYYLKYETLSESNKLIIYKHITDYLTNVQESGQDESDECGQINGVNFIIERDQIIGSNFIIDRQTGKIKFETMLGHVMTYDQIRYALDIEFGDGYWSVGDDSIKLDIEFGDGYWSVGDDSIKLGDILMLPNCRIEANVYLIYESIHIN